jgi:hypothetical protein
MSIIAFDRQSLKAIEVDLEIALKAVADKHGIALVLGGGRFSANLYKPKIEFATKGESGEVHSRERSDFRVFAGYHGLRPDDLGKAFVYQGRRYTLEGYKHASRKAPFLGKRDDGKVFKFPVEIVKTFIQHQPDGKTP